MKSISLLLITFLWTFNIRCQVQSKGRFNPDQFDKALLGSPKSIFRLPTLNNAALRLAAQHGRPGPTKFGEAIPFRVDMQAGDGEWTEDHANGIRKWRVMITSRGAKSLSLLFDQFYLPQDGELYVLGEMSMLGAYIGQINNKVDRKFATQPIFGDTLVMEYIEPLERDKELLGNAEISIQKVVHGFMSLKYGESGSCNVDVRCPIGNPYRKQIDAVAVMITDQGQRFCSGVMINNTSRNGAQYFLTASHCVYTDESYFILGFNYEYNACRSGGMSNAVLNMPQTVQGLKLVAQYNNSDFALFLVVENIPDSYGVFLAGWDNRKIPPKGVAGIHHPSGDAKKISTYSGQTTAASWTEGSLQFHWEVPYWQHGSTEPGSSGSPLFNDRGLVVGHLHGGQSSCDFRKGYDMYGAIWADWAGAPPGSPTINSVSSFLNPLGGNIQALAGMYLSDVTERVVPNVQAIKPLYKAPRPHFPSLNAGGSGITLSTPNSHRVTGNNASDRNADKNQEIDNQIKNVKSKENSGHSNTDHHVYMASTPEEIDKINDLSEGEIDSSVGKVIVDKAPSGPLSLRWQSGHLRHQRPINMDSLLK